MNEMIYELKTKKEIAKLNLQISFGVFSML
jgi:hypothetical protein